MRAPRCFAFAACVFLLALPPVMAQSFYWEAPEALGAQGVRWASSETGGGGITLAWEEIVPTPGKNEGVLYLSAAVSTDGVGWSYNRRFLGPLKYSGVDPGQEPRVYSMVAGPDGRIIFAVSTSEKEITILGADRALAFQPLARVSTPLTSVTPNLFMTARGSLLLFSTQAAATGPDTSSQGQVPPTLAWSRSDDGRTWTPFVPFVAPEETGSGILLQPDHSSSSGREIVVFQSEKVNAADFHVYSKTSTDGGRTWSQAREITSLPLFNEKVGGADHPPRDFTNVRPRIFPAANGLTLVWERSLLGTAAPSLYSIGLDESGAPTGSAESLTPGASSIFGQMIRVGSRTLLLYAQNAGGAYRVVLSEKSGTSWSPTVLGRALGGNSQFPHAVVLNGSLFVFWENGPVVTTAATPSSLMELRPKTAVASPQLVAVGFTPGKPEKADNATIRWRQPEDSAGIDAYEVTLRLNGTPVAPVHRITADPNELTVSFPWAFSRDGTWRFEVVALDIAKNRSPSATIDFVRDTTPPRPVALVPPQAGPDGFLPSNSFTVTLTPPDDPDVAGYTWEEQAVGATLPEYQAGKPALRPPPARVLTTRTVLAFSNLDNGVHVITVGAVDQAGNVSDPVSLVVQLNKFSPFTAIYALLRSADEQGNVTVALRGRGFLTNGMVQELYLSRSDAAPWDRILKPGSGGFTVVSDSLITGLVLDNTFGSGKYRIGLLQPPAKPWFWQGGSISFESPGTVRFGNFALKVPRWLGGTTPRYDVSFNTLLLAAVLALLAVLLVFSIRRMASLAQEGFLLRGEITALLEGRSMSGWEERNRKMKELKRRGVGLRLKFTLLMVVLVTIIVLGVSVWLGAQMIGSSGRSLASELEKRTNILISTMAANAQAEIQKGPVDGSLGIIAVPDNIRQMDEAKSATITGPAAGGTDTISREYVWASNAEAWKKRQAAKTFVFAAEVESDALSPRVTALQKSLDDAALTGLTDLMSRWQQTRDRIDVLNGKARRTAAEQQELLASLREVQTTVADINTAAKTLEQSGVRSEPSYDLDRVAQSPGRYLFYKPIVYFQPGDKSFYQGLVRMEIDTTRITDQIRQSRQTLIASTGLIALVAIGLGVLGAIIMASITITPIRKLVQGVTHIGSTEDKEQLKEYAIQVRSRDEIGQLADTVNDMTRGLVKAAIANKELMLGKDVQKMFLPLEKDREGRKGSTAGTDTKDVEIYGYYEGAKEVSGDYFDFRQLDATHYAIIKCDVSGHGVSAGLIMVEVATLFISHFRDWQRRKESLAQIRDPEEKKRVLRDLQRLDTLVYTINDMIEERGFKGLFAAFTLGILDTATGEISACPAGDKEIHIYDVSEKRMVHSKFTKGEGSPAAGAFASMLVEMKSGFPQFPIHLEHGDVLFLPTDGIDEAKRFLRDTSFEVVKCLEPGLKEGDFHLNTHKYGENTEDFGQARMDEFISGVFNKGRVNLVRHHNPTPDEVLEFDFTSGEGTVKEAVLALVSAEKLFRLVLAPKAGEGHRVAVDAKIDTFLQKHFVQYQRYFAHRLEGQPDDAYVQFSHLVEDEQRDDLTILVMRRK